MISHNISFDSPEVKAMMLATRYRREQESTAIAAIKACPNKARSLELYAGTGGLTEIYRTYFTNVLTNDINKEAKTDTHLSALDFIERYLPSEVYSEKLDLIDFDCYGSPCKEIQKYFDIRGNFDAPFVLRFSDGKGLWMKRFMPRNETGKEEIRKAYLIENEVVLDKIWRRHPELIDYFMHKLAGKHGMVAKRICMVQTKYLTYTLGAYLFTKI